MWGVGSRVERVAQADLELSILLPQPPRVVGMTSMLYQAQLNSTLSRVQPGLGTSAASEIHLFLFSNLTRAGSHPCLHGNSGLDLTAEPGLLGLPASPSLP